MSDQEIIRSRYSKGEIIEVIHGVATLMGARRKKAFFSSETKKIYFEISFMEQQLETINVKLQALETTILKTEETARGPADTLLNLRAVKKTLASEHLRLQEYEKKSKRIVKEKNLARIDSLTEEVVLFDTHTIGFAENQLKQSQSRFDGVYQQKQNLIEKLQHLWAEYRKALDITHKQREIAHQQMAGLEASTNELAQELDQNLGIEELELRNELKVLDEQRAQLEQNNLALVENLQRLQATKKKVDSLDDPEAYMNQLRKNLEEDKLSTEAKKDVLAAVTAIIKEVDEINHTLTETITEYRQGMDEFEQNLMSFHDEEQTYKNIK